MKTLITIFCLCFGLTLSAQHNIFEQALSIDSSGAAPDASALLEVNSKSQGILIPRMSTAERMNIPLPALGLMVYDTQEQALYRFHGTWKRDHDEDSSNEIQTLSLSGSDLTISGGNTVPLPSGGSSLWDTGTGSTIHYDGGNVGIGSIANSTNTLYVDQGTSGATARFFNDYSGSSSKLGLDVQLSGGSGTKTGILVQSTGGSSTSVSGLTSYIISGSNPGTYRSVNASVSGNGVALYGAALDNNGAAAEFNGDVSIGHNTKEHNQVALHGLSGTSGDTTSILFSEDDDGTFGMFMMYEGVDNQLQIFGKAINTLYGPHFSMDRNSGNLFLPGSIAVGGESFATGFALSVHGKTICEEMQIELVTNWPDYVFTSDYKLKTLEETEEFINENGHLPGIPSAVEVEKNGFAVGDMQKRMMEKIEELTLHMIALNKENQELKIRLDELESK